MKLNDVWFESQSIEDLVRFKQILLNLNKDGIGGEKMIADREKAILKVEDIIKARREEGQPENLPPVTDNLTN